ncbi:efflux RND transporter periplasmic adaptor subunit [Roseibium salinum]|uniref:efflux RND transporter periplasmic adaptor subunit n=1 Tax=Roseibium salinum TaxID=1604349 RepID=UPI00360F3136
MKRRKCRVAAISHASGFGNKMNLIRDIGSAMDEAVDQNAVIVYPAEETWEYRVSLAHEELARLHRSGAILTVPLQAGGKIIGAMTLQRPAGNPFDGATVDLCDAVAAVVGPVLQEKRLNDRYLILKIFDSAGEQLKRLFGAGYFGRKLATAIAVALVTFFSLATTDYSVTSPAIIRGTVQRTIVAPFNGYVADEGVRSGELVKKGQELARLDDQDLSFERLRLATTRQQKMTEYDRALTLHERAEALIIKAQVEQTEAQLALIDEQLRRTRLVAPFDGYVVEGDLSQSIGAVVERGEELFKIAPLDSYRVLLEVDEVDIGNIKIGQSGVLRVTALPREPMTYRIEQITAISEQKEGRNYFRVEASLDKVTGRLRPGMEGIAKTSVDTRLLISTYTEKMINWIYLATWRWIP